MCYRIQAIHKINDSGKERWSAQLLEVIPASKAIMAVLSPHEENLGSTSLEPNSKGAKWGNCVLENENGKPLSEWKVGDILKRVL